MSVSPASTQENAAALESQLTHRGIKPTALRVLILRTLHELNRAASLTDIETRLVTVDKSTIFRTLTLFLAHHLVHGVEDGSGQMKYALCADDCRCGDEEVDAWSDLHAHFYCERCHHTYCLRGLPIPAVALPHGFQLHTAMYVLKGLCPQCAGRRFPSAGSGFPETQNNAEN